MSNNSEHDRTAQVEAGFQWKCPVCDLVQLCDNTSCLIHCKRCTKLIHRTKLSVSSNTSSDFPIIIKRRRLRDNSGPTNKYGPAERFVLIDEKYYPVNWIKSIPGLVENDLCHV